LVLSVCYIYISKSTNTQAQALLGSIMFLHKAIKPAQLFVNSIIALLGAWDRRPQGPSMRALIGTSYGLLPAPMWLMVPLPGSPSSQYNMQQLSATDILDCDLAFSHFPRLLYTVADLLSHWDASACPTASLFFSPHQHSLEVSCPLWGTCVALWHLVYFAPQLLPFLPAVCRRLQVTAHLQCQHIAWPPWLWLSFAFISPFLFLLCLVLLYPLFL
jgi:hypothetical protein